jgi:hypothetical protein
MERTLYPRLILLLLSFALVIPGCDSGSYGGEEPDSGDGDTPPTGENTPPPPASLPTFASVSLFSDDGPFNQPLPSTPEIDPNSATLAGSLLRAGALVVSVRQYSTPVFFADATTPRHDVSLECGGPWELGVTTMVGVPIPDHARPAFDADGADNPPRGCGEDSDQDNFMVVLDTGSRCEYDLWQARKSDGVWAASWGNRISIDQSGVYPNGLSARGSGFAFLGGVIWPDELASGRIEHALAFSYPFTKSGGPVAPATESDGESNDGDALPEGARLQLNPNLDLTSLNLTVYELVIARAMQEFGLLLVDNGGDTGIGLYAIDPKSVSGNLYDDILPDQDIVGLPNIPLDQFRVLKLGPQNRDFQSDLRVVEDACAVMR